MLEGSSVSFYKRIGNLSVVVNNAAQVLIFVVALVVTSLPPSCPMKSVFVMMITGNFVHSDESR